MSLAVQVLQSGCDYAQALLQELDLEISEPSWFSAYLKVRELERMLGHHLDAVDDVMAGCMEQLPEAEREAVRTFQREHFELKGGMARLVAAVHDRDAVRASEQVQTLRSALTQAARHCAGMLPRIEAITGDLSRPLGLALSSREIT